MMVMMMRKLGYELLVAANGQEVLTMLEVEAKKGKDREVECILMDASMVSCTQLSSRCLFEEDYLAHPTLSYR